MKTKLQEEVKGNSRIRRFAKRNYEVYKAHFKSRNLNPVLTLEEFMKNYTSE